MTDARQRFSRPRRVDRRLRGITLIEVMVVLLVIALVATGVIYGVGALTRAELRKGAVHIISQCRYAYNYAVVNNKTVRLVFDFDANTIVLQEAHGRVTLTSAEDPQRLDLERDDANADVVAVDPWAAATARLEEATEPSLGGSPFTNLQNREPVPIGRNLDIVRLYTPHEPHARELGTGALYFFPNGMTEDAIIQLSDDDGETVYSIEVQQMTARTKIYTYALEPDRDLSEAFSEVDEP